MNIITNSLKRLTETYARQCLQGRSIALPAYSYTNNIAGTILTRTRAYLTNTIQGLSQSRTMVSLIEMHRRGPLKWKKKSKNPFNGQPFAKGVVLRTVIRKPKKPNSANRKCVIVKLSNGKEMTAYVPGIGHNLQEHSVVLCKVGRCKDVPGVKIKCVRGVYDLPHVQPKRQ